MYNLSELIVVTTVVRHNHLMTLKVGKSQMLLKAVHVCTQRKPPFYRVKEQGKAWFLCDFLCVCLCVFLRAHLANEGYVGWECYCAYIIMSLHKLATTRNTKTISLLTFLDSLWRSTSGYRP
jgi:hypothetical protein